MYQFTSDFGGNIILAPCLQTFCAEVQLATKLGLIDVTNLGQIGDTRHQGEGTGSDHNPWMQGPDGKWLVRALDFGGRDWAVLLEFWNHQYGAGDQRVRQFGYTNSNLAGKYTGLTIWGGDGSTRPGTDGAHGHHSANQANGYNPTPGRSGFVAALYDRSPWGLITWLQARSSNPTPAITTERLTVWEDDVDFTLKPGEERLVAVPRGATYCKMAAYAGDGRLQVQGFDPNGKGHPLGGSLDDAKAQLLRAYTPLVWAGADFSETKYPTVFFRNTGKYLVAVTIGRA